MSIALFGIATTWTFANEENENLHDSYKWQQGNGAHFWIMPSILSCACGTHMTRSQLLPNNHSSGDTVTRISNKTATQNLSIMARLKFRCPKYRKRCLEDIRLVSAPCCGIYQASNEIKWLHYYAGIILSQIKSYVRLRSSQENCWNIRTPSSFPSIT